MSYHHMLMLFSCIAICLSSNVVSAEEYAVNSSITTYDSTEKTVINISYRLTAQENEDGLHVSLHDVKIRRTVNGQDEPLHDATLYDEMQKVQIVIQRDEDGKHYKTVLRHGNDLFESTDSRRARRVEEGGSYDRAVGGVVELIRPIVFDRTSSMDLGAIVEVQTRRLQPNELFSSQSLPLRYMVAVGKDASTLSLLSYESSFRGDNKAAVLKYGKISLGTEGSPLWGNQTLETQFVGRGADDAPVSVITKFTMVPVPDRE